MHTDPEGTFTFDDLRRLIDELNEEGYQEQRRYSEACGLWNGIMSGTRTIFQSRESALAAFAPIGLSNLKLDFLERCGVAGRGIGDYVIWIKKPGKNFKFRERRVRANR